MVSSVKPVCSFDQFDRLGGMACPARHYRRNGDGGCGKILPLFGVFLLLSVWCGVEWNLAENGTATRKACFVTHHPVMPLRGGVCDVLGRRVRGAVRIVGRRGRDGPRGVGVRRYRRWRAVG